jgi:Raf kinase inhibitor-like YbhB/YbcL family protein
MKLQSAGFKDGDVLPDRFSQYRDNRSPPLNFAAVPPEARSLVVIMEDPDTAHGTFTHWIAYGIDPETRGFPENAIPDNVGLGRNDAGQAAYAGPKPPAGEHRYFFHAYALDNQPLLPHGVSRATVERAMLGHVIAEAELMGRYAAPREAFGGWGLPARPATAQGS